MQIEIRISGPRAEGKSIVARTIIRELRRLGFLDIRTKNVTGPHTLTTLTPQQLDAKVTVTELRPIRGK